MGKKEIHGNIDKITLKEIKESANIIAMSLESLKIETAQKYLEHLVSSPDSAGFSINFNNGALFGGMLIANMIDIENYGEMVSTYEVVEFCINNNCRDYNVEHDLIDYFMLNIKPSLYKTREELLSAIQNTTQRRVNALKNFGFDYEEFTKQQITEKLEKLNSFLGKLETEYKQGIEENPAILKSTFNELDFQKMSKNATKKILGDLIVTSGIIIASDPGYIRMFESAIPLNRKFPAGKFPVELTILEGCVLVSRIIFSSGPAVMYEKAIPAGYTRALKEKQHYLNGVDTGSFGFFDFDCFSEMQKELILSGNFGNIESVYGDIVEIGNTNAAFFASGYGDGAYPCYIGRDSSQNIVSLVADFSSSFDWSNYEVEPAIKGDDTIRYFEYRAGGSNKFWSIAIKEKSFKVIFGKIGTEGQTSEKEFNDEASCKKAAEKLINEKRNKGYDELINGKFLGTELVDATSSGNLQKVKELLANGGNINTRDKSGYSLLMIAALRGNFELVKFMMENGADINIKASQCETALYAGISSGNSEIVKLLIDSGSDIHLVSEFGETFLMQAARSGNLEIVKVLIENGADQSVKLRGKETALSFAKKNGHKEICDYLLKIKAEEVEAFFNSIENKYLEQLSKGAGKSGGNESEYCDSELLKRMPNIEENVIGNITIGSGLIVVTDPSYIIQSQTIEPYNCKFPIGEFPVKITHADGRVLTAQIDFSSNKVSTWEKLARISLDDSKLFHFSCDGIASFIDFECFKEIQKKLIVDGKFDIGDCTIGNISTFGDKNAAFFSSGYGEFLCHIGKDSNGNIACLVADFSV
jgi:ankyrin repeat protein